MKRPARQLFNWKRRFRRAGMKRVFTAIFVLALAVLINTNLLRADQQDYLFRKGNDLYQKGEYEAAISAYGEILKMGYESPELYYNLGNAYYKLRKIGPAVLFYNRALRLAPRDGDIRHNLELVNLRVVDRIQAIPDLFYSRYFKAFQNFFGMAALFWIVAISYVLLVIFIILTLLLRKEAVRRIVRQLAWIIGIVFVIFVFTWGTKVWMQKHAAEAVVLVSKVDVKSAPDQNGTIMFSLHEGVKVRVKQKTNGWFEIRLADGKQGWLPGKSVGII